MSHGDDDNPFKNDELYFDVHKNPIQEHRFTKQTETDFEKKLFELHATRSAETSHRASAAMGCGIGEAHRLLTELPSQSKNIEDTRLIALYSVKWLDEFHRNPKYLLTKEEIQKMAEKSQDLSIAEYCVASVPEPNVAKIVETTSFMFRLVVIDDDNRSHYIFQMPLTAFFLIFVFDKKKFFGYYYRSE